MYLKLAEMEEAIPNPGSNEYEDKNAFMILTQGSHLESRIKKMCEAFGASFFPCPESQQELKKVIQELKNKENDLNMVLAENAKGSEREYLDIAENYDAWRVRILKEKSIFHTLNLFRYNLNAKTFIAEGWCPDEGLEQVGAATQRATRSSGSAFPVVFKSIPVTKETPPTYFKTNKFTQAHQEIVDAYGVARYQEINPTVFSIVTFPFLFGVMFGDVGHGIIMLLFVLFLIAKEEEFMKGGLNEMVQTCFDGRYIIVLMSIFAIYCGFMYNECFSVPMAFTGFPAASQYNLPNGSTVMTLNTEGYRYPFGVDPAWKGATNELYYYNSLKMKMSVLMGVTQMMLGICLSGWNAVYSEKPYDFYYQFVPQALFMMSIFGYLSILIVAKWLIQWEDVIADPDRNVPSLLSALVNMFLSPTSVNGEFVSERIWGSQQAVQLFLLALALICVPWMLFPKPFLLRRDHSRERKGYAGVDLEDDGSQAEDEEEPFEFQEVMIHQIIHTIEFVLGAISNTASYLRLWALSLAHSELSTVFWEKVFVGALESGSVPAMVIGFAAWAVLSFAVLMVMESLSAFLHALRLHWVEFQNKFYGGDGQKFAPFCFERIVTGEEF
jgi:V-type H+-transporting ATPase subunit a